MELRLGSVGYQLKLYYIAPVALYFDYIMYNCAMLSDGFHSFMQGSEIYGRELVDLRKESRWEFLNTFFSVSEAVAYLQVFNSL